MTKMLSPEDLEWYKNQSPTSINGSVWDEFNSKKKIRRDLDHYCRDRYLEEEISPRLKQFSTPLEKVDYLIEHKYYDRKIWDQYSRTFLEKAYKVAFDYGFKFESYSAANQFFTTGSMKTLDNETWLESFEDRVVANALFLGRGDEALVMKLIPILLSGEYQPATPTWMNAGRVRRGEFVSCFLLNTNDSLAHIHRNLASLAMLSKAGGGVSICLTNVRAEGAPIQGYKDRAATILHIVKLVEREAAYANQLGTRKGAAVCWWNALHRDTPTVLDARKIKYNGDPDFMLRTVNLGLVIPDILMEKAIADEDICLLDPYDVKAVTGKPWSTISIDQYYDEIVAHPDVRKKWVSARKLFHELSHLNAQAGMPFILFEGNANRHSPYKGWIGYSNLCSEILQTSRLPKVKEDLSYEDVGADINCVLGSLGTYKVLHGKTFAETVDASLRALLSVSEQADFSVVPSLEAGNNEGHPVGLGVMDFAAFLASEKIAFGTPESKEFADLFFRTMKFWTLKTNCDVAQERKSTFFDFHESGYADGSYLKSYTESIPSYSAKVMSLVEKYSIPLPSPEDWKALDARIREHGLFMRYMMAVAPTGNISYVRGASASMAPVSSVVEFRRSGTTGSFYHLAPHVTEETLKYFVPSHKVDIRDFIDVYAEATKHVDQGISMSIYEPTGNTTSKWYNYARTYAWRRGIKTIYYTKVNNKAERPDSEESIFQGSTRALTNKAVEPVECEACGI